MNKSQENIRNNTSSEESTIPEIIEPEIIVPDTPQDTIINIKSDKPLDPKTIKKYQDY